MDAKLAAIFRPGVLPHEGAGDCPRERLVTGIRIPMPDGRLLPDRGRRWLCEGQYRSLIRAGARMVVLEER